MTALLERIPFGGDLIDHARDYAEQCAESLADSESFPTVLHVVSDEECTTRPWDLDGLHVSDLRSLAAMASALISSSEAKWMAIQVGVWMDITGDAAALLSNPKPHPLVSEGLALVIIDAEGSDFHVAEVQRRGDCASLSRWHEMPQGLCCDANGVCS